MARTRNQGGASALPTNVTPLWRRKRTAKANRPEDMTVASFRNMARNALDKAETTDDPEERWQLISLYHVATNKLPRNNLRIIPNYGRDEKERFWILYRRYEVAEAEHRAVEARVGYLSKVAEAEGGMIACCAVYDEWRERRDQACQLAKEARADLINFPVETDWFHSIKCKAAGSIECIAYHQPELAVILKEERARLDAAKAERRAARAAKKAARSS